MMSTDHWAASVRKGQSRWIINKLRKRKRIKVRLDEYAMRAISVPNIKKIRLVAEKVIAAMTDRFTMAYRRGLLIWARAMLYFAKKKKASRTKAIRQHFRQFALREKPSMILGLWCRNNRMMAKIKVIKEWKTRVSEKAFSANHWETGAKAMKKRAMAKNSSQNLLSLHRLIKRDPSWFRMRIAVPRNLS